MLNDHWNGTHSVLGKWNDVRLEGSTLSGEPEFDTDDDEAVRISKKVDKGYIRACSMGLTFDRDNLEYVNGELILRKCELFEVSIVAIPSNANSLRLYNQEGELLSETEVETMCLSAIPSDNEKPDHMKKIVLSVATMMLLGFDAGTTEANEAEVENKIKDLAAAKDAAELALSQIKEREEQAKLAAITAKVDGAIKAVKLSAEKRDKYIALGVANPELLDDLIGAIPEKTSLGAQVKNTTVTAEVKTPQDFQKLSTEDQLSWKAANPEAYINLFKR